MGGCKQHEQQTSSHIGENQTPSKLQLLRMFSANLPNSSGTRFWTTSLAYSIPQLDIWSLASHNGPSRVISSWGRIFIKLLKKRLINLLNQRLLELLLLHFFIQRLRKFLCWLANYFCCWKNTHSSCPAFGHNLGLLKRGILLRQSVVLLVEVTTKNWCNPKILRLS